MMTTLAEIWMAFNNFSFTPLMCLLWLPLFPITSKQ